jgi:hypothetical protein
MFTSHGGVFVGTGGLVWTHETIFAVNRSLWCVRIRTAFLRTNGEFAGRMNVVALFTKRAIRPRAARRVRVEKWTISFGTLWIVQTTRRLFVVFGRHNMLIILHCKHNRSRIPSSTLNLLLWLTRLQF